MRQLHREFLRAGANVMQTFTFYASDDKLENRGNKLTFTVSLAMTPHITHIIHPTTHISITNLVLHRKSEIVSFSFV